MHYFSPIPALLQLVLPSCASCITLILFEDTVYLSSICWTHHWYWRRFVSILRVLEFYLWLFTLVCSTLSFRRVSVWFCVQLMFFCVFELVLLAAGWCVCCCPCCCWCCLSGMSQYVAILGLQPHRTTAPPSVNGGLGLSGQLADRLMPDHHWEMNQMNPTIIILWVFLSELMGS